MESFRGGTDTRADDVASLIQSFAPAPDVVALSEIEDSHGAFLFIENYFPDYIGYITEGQNNKEILVAINHSNFDFVTINQKYKFKIGNPNLRPGVLLTLKQGNIYTNLLVLHSASMTLADGFGDRYEIIKHAFDLNERIQELSIAVGIPPRLIITGDLNTMGLQFPRTLVAHWSITGPDEIEGVAHLASRAHIDGQLGMSFAPKQYNLTFSNKSGSKTGDLDHVVLSAGLNLTDLGNLADGSPFQVRVEGWQQLAGNTRSNFIDNISDHCALYFTVQ